MKRTLTTIFPLIASFALAGIVFYYLIVVPMSGGYNVSVQYSGLKTSYLPGEKISVGGILANNSKNASEFAVSVGINGADRAKTPVESKKYFLVAGERRHFSFHIETPAAIDGKKSVVVSVSRPSKMPLFKDVVVYSRKIDAYFLPPAVSAPFASDLKFTPRRVAASRPARPSRYVEEIVTARFSARFPERAHYRKVAKMSARVKNTSSSRERFEIFLKIVSPSGVERVTSSPVTLAPDEEKQLDFLYNVTENHAEGDYNVSAWYCTRQAKSEEIIEGKFSLADEEPRLKIKKMLVNPAAGEASAILVEAYDDIGVKEVVFMAAAQNRDGSRSEYKNIPMYLASGDERNGVWRCDYVPQKSDAYVFSFVAADSKRQRARLGEFPIKVIR